ncbi:MAG: hypothetical protein CM1200mP39_22560 [Dehalococcoidia bacterium]|nr:MAG: hypothetical protein CM1200mP39_22560 [Dehalococcoidia bacterium]
MKRLGMNDSDILEVMGWKDVTMLRGIQLPLLRTCAIGSIKNLVRGFTLVQSK